MVRLAEKLGLGDPVRFERGSRPACPMKPNDRPPYTNRRQSIPVRMSVILPERWRLGHTRVYRRCNKISARAINALLSAIQLDECCTSPASKSDKPARTNKCSRWKRRAGIRRAGQATRTLGDSRFARSWRVPVMRERYA